MKSLLSFGQPVVSYLPVVQPALRSPSKNWVIASATIDSVDVKGFERGSPTVWVKQKIQYRKEHVRQPAIVEERTHVFLTDPVRKRLDHQGE